MRLQHHTQTRRGVVLLAVLMVVVVLSLAAYKYNDWMLAEYRASEMTVRASQSRAFAESGVHYAAALLAGDTDSTLAGNPWDNASLFQGIAVPHTGTDPWTGRFSIVSLRGPEDGGGTGYRFGVTDEASKINLNALLALDRSRGGGRRNQGISDPANSASRQILMGLESLGMNEEIANSILNWMDPNGVVRSPGADATYYSSLNPPYRMKAGPLDSLEELLLVKGVTAQLLYGSDRNRNGVIDADEDDGSGTAGLGWSAYLTVYSREINVDSAGAPRININDQDLTKIYDPLVQAVGQSLADYIVAYRLYGGSSTTNSGRGTQNPRGGVGTLSRDQTTTVTTQVRTARTASRGSGGQSQQQLRNIRSLWDLVNSQVSVPGQNGQAAITYPSPLNDVGQQEQLLPTLLDKCTTTAGLDMTPRINLNTASPTVLMAIASYARLTDAEVQTIIGQRPSPSGVAPDPIYKSMAWLYTRANLSLAKIRRLDPILTGRTQVYRVQSVGYFDRGGPMSRVEAVIDTNQGRPRIVYWRDLSELGRGFNFSGNEN